MKDDEQPLSTTNRSKKAYHKPQLQVYGQLKDITQSLGPSGALDGGGIPPLTNRTHL
jgi:hypothetical protein